MYHVHTLARAQVDLDRIVRYIANEQRSPQGAAHLLIAFESALEKLVKNPFAYGFAQENDRVEYDLREFPFKTKRGRTYRGVFTTVGEEIRILRIRGPGQAPLDADELGE